LVSEIDQIDAKIIKELLKDGRTCFSEIAQACCVSTNAIVKRYDRLKKEKIITGSTIIVRLDEFGFNFIVSIDMNVDANQEEKIMELVKALPNYFTCNAAVGKYDIHAVILAKDFQEINEVRNSLKQQKGIKRIKITANTDKFFYFPENLLVISKGET
jgi:DNA-binding Lrp family transcriptional regulator